MSTLSIRAPHVPYGWSLPGFARIVSFVEAVLDVLADADRQDLNEGVTGAVVEGVLPVLVGELTEVVLFETTAAAGWLGATAV